MATVTYQQFYYLPDDEFIELEGLNAYFEHHKNYDLYKDEMYCPECLQCKLEYTPEYSRKAYLSAKDVNQHDDACSFKYEPATTKTVTTYFQNLNPTQIESKLDSMLNRLHRSPKQIQSDSGKLASSNPFIINDGDVDNSPLTHRKVLRQKKLGRTLRKEDQNQLFAFYGTGTLKIEECEGEREGRKYKYYYLYITVNATTYKVYRGKHHDQIEEEALYNIVLIGYVEGVYTNGIVKIELIKKEPGNSTPNQLAIKLRKV